jgi:hypothetical protein
MADAGSRKSGNGDQLKAVCAAVSLNDPGAARLKDRSAPSREGATSSSNVRDFPVPIARRWSRMASSAKIEMLGRQSEQEGKSWKSLLPSALISQKM